MIMRQARSRNLARHQRLPCSRLGRFEWSHEHLIQPQRVGAIIADDIVGVHHVAAALAHLLRASFNANGRVGGQHELIA